MMEYTLRHYRVAPTGTEPPAFTRLPVTAAVSLVGRRRGAIRVACGRPCPQRVGSGAVSGYPRPSRVAAPSRCGELAAAVGAVGAARGDAARRR